MGEADTQIEQLRDAGDAEGLIQVMRHETTAKRDAAQALFELSDPTSVTGPLTAFLRSRGSLVKQWERDWREFQSGSGIPWTDREFGDMAEADMVAIELQAIRFFRGVGTGEGLQVIASTTTDPDVRSDAQAALGNLS